MRALRYTCLLASLAVTPVTMLAQQRPAEHLCLSPHPLKQCENFLFFDAQLIGVIGTGPHAYITTFAVNGGPITIQRTLEDFGTYGAGIVGFMSNRDSTHALGASLEFGYAGAEHPRISAKLHRRTWLPSGNSFDLSAGLLAAEVPRPDDGPGSQCPSCLKRAWSYGITSDVALVERHGLGLMGGADFITGSGRTSLGAHAGVRTEGWAAIGATLLAGLLGAAASALFASSDF